MPMRQQVCPHITRPAVRLEPVLAPQPLDSNAPDNLAAMFYGTVMQDPGPFGGKFRMWYHACHWGINPDLSPDMARQLAKYKDPFFMGPPCYAESDDGIHWRRPALNQFAFKGTTQHNAIDLPHVLTAGVNVIRDDDDPDPSRRYKMIYQFFPRYSEPPLAGQGKTSTIATAVSPDGLRWTLAGVPYVDQFIEHCALYKHQGKYIVNYQAGDGWGAHFSEGGHTSGRVGLARYSYDFDHWSEGFVESLVMPEPTDPNLRGSKQTYIHNHLGTAATSFGNVCVGLYGIWHNKPDFHDISCDLGLALSHDGLTFYEPVKGHVFIHSTESPIARASEIHFNNNLTQGNGIFNVGDETRIYHGRWRNTGFRNLEHYYGEVALATIPRDRWGAMAVFPNREVGSVFTRELTLADPAGVTLNAEDAGAMTVDVVTPTFEPLVTGVRVQGGSGLDLPLAWPDGARQRLAGRPVCVGVRLSKQGGANPRLYAVNVAG